MTGSLELDHWSHKGQSPIDGLDFDQYSARIGLDNRIGSRTNARLDLLQTDRDSDNPLDQYTENRVDLSISYAWNRGL